MEKFVEFVTEYISYGMKLYVKLEDGNLVHVKDYSPFCDYELYPVDETDSRIDHVYSEYGVSYFLRDGRMFAVTFDENRAYHETELTLEMLLNKGDTDESHETYEDLVC